MITHPVAAPQRRLPSAVVLDGSCPLRRAGEQPRKLLKVEGYSMHSPDRSQTVIIDLDLLAKQFQVTAWPRRVPLAAAGQPAQTAERPTAAELAPAQRCGKTTGPKSPPHRESPPDTLHYA
jgi:hypothetical protein